MLLDCRRKLGVEGARENLRQLLEDDDPESAGAEGLGHLEADVAGSDDHRGRASGSVLERLLNRERLRDGVQDVHAVRRP